MARFFPVARVAASGKRKLDQAAHSPRNSQIISNGGPGFLAREIPETGRGNYAPAGAAASTQSKRRHPQPETRNAGRDRSGAAPASLVMRTAKVCIGRLAWLSSAFKTHGQTPKNTLGKAHGALADHSRDRDSTIVRTGLLVCGASQPLREIRAGRVASGFAGRVAAVRW